MVVKWPFMSHKFSAFFLTKLQKTGKKVNNVFYVVALITNKIWTSWAPQNDCQKLSFVKDINVVGEKMTRNGQKWPLVLD